VKANLLITAPSAVKILLLNQLKLAINLYINKLELAEDIVNYEVGIKIENIPLQRIHDDEKVIYGSAIALKLASKYNLTALAIANQLATYLEFTTDFNSSEIILDFFIEVANGGWIYFHLNNSSIAVWLQHLLEIPKTLFNQFKISEVKNIELKRSFNTFSLQYTHARCCSLLRLGEQESLIKISSDNHQGKFYIVEPKPIPWLNSGLIAKAFGNLAPAIPASGGMEFCSLHLIEQLLDLLDELSTTNLTSPQKATSRLISLTISLSEAMINFDRSCRILGQVKTHPQLTQARLGLVAVTQSLLQFMLRDIFGISAPEEL
jgi:arginyl-tRNA synthetase